MYTSVEYKSMHASPGVFLNNKMLSSVSHVECKGSEAAEQNKRVMEILFCNDRLNYQRKHFNVYG